MNATTERSKADADALDRMIDEELGARDDELAPSSGFLLSVMSAIEREAAGPPPIPFPWRRVVPGLAAALCGLALLVLAMLSAVQASGLGLARVVETRSPLDSLAFTPGGAVLLGMLIAASVTAGSIAMSLRMAGCSR